MTKLYFAVHQRTTSWPRCSGACGLSLRAEVVLDEAERIHSLLAEAAAAPLPEDAGLTERRAEELIAEIRAGRDAR